MSSVKKTVINEIGRGIEIPFIKMDENEKRCIASILLAKWIWRFSVSQHEVDTITAYIANQHEHHRNITFQEEFRAILKQHNIEFDERYVWD